MSTSAVSGLITVALIGNPNTGKSTLFGALCGVRQRVGNYPGVTVEKKLGTTQFGQRQVQIIDLPGTYSLSPRSPDEMIAVDVLLGRRSDVRAIDLVVCVVDASNLQRNLFLVSQVFETGLPIVVALTMVDIAEAKGMVLDLDQLQQRLGVPVVPVHAQRGVGLERLRSECARMMESPPPSRPSCFPVPFQEEVDRLSAEVSGANWPRFLVQRLLLDTGGFIQGLWTESAEHTPGPAVESARNRLAALGMPVPAIESIARYTWAEQVLAGAIQQAPSCPQITLSDRIDRVLTHRIAGTCLLAGLLLVLFQAIFRWAIPAMDAIETAITYLGQTVTTLLPAGAVRDMLVDGVLAGVGGVLVFLPQIFILFFFLAILEDCGYLARAAYLMDRLLAPTGLSGKSFIPLLSSFACAVPGIMATRVIENRRDRLTTILIAPLMSCSARLPVYTLLIGAFIPAESYLLAGLVGLQGFTMFSLYLLGIVVAAAMATIFNRTLLRGEPAPFVMELPGYKWPSVSVVLHRMLDRGWAFVRRAGTLILAVSIVIWGATYFPHPPHIAEELRARYAGATVDDDIISQEIASAYLQQSWLARLGRSMEPITRPLGWDWRIASAVVASFPAREVVVSTLSVIYSAGEGEDEQSIPLRGRLQSATWDGTNRPVFTIATALSLMVFFALCAQCAATLVVIRRETNSWRWPCFTFTYMTLLAYVAALVTYQIASRVGGL